MVGVFFVFQAGRPVRLALTKSTERTFALLWVGPIDGEDTIEVIGLVLEHPGSPPCLFDQELLAILVLSPHTNRDRALYLQRHLGDTQTTLQSDLGFFRRPLDLRVDHDPYLVALIRPVNEQASEYPELGCSQTAPWGVHDYALHPLYLGRKPGPEIIDPGSRRPQNGVPKPDHLGQRCLTLGYLFRVGCSRLFVVLGLDYV